ncbi:outer membrane lipoprotein-sorting protein [Selenihalanaerobacter shriftii]|nr:outer membrane lipoprotein-sorting protein [Selenihalanaerobacter shriftii]
MLKKLCTIFLIMLLVLSIGVGLKSNVIQAKELSVNEIVRKAYKAANYSGDDERGVINMTIVDSQGRKRHRELLKLKKDIEDNGDQKFYVYFKRPADVRKMVFMVYKHPGSQDDRWLYLPALDLVQRIAAGDKRTSFAGSHFTYEDVSGRALQLDKHILLGEEDGKYIIKNLPKDAEDVEFSYYKMWIDKEIFLPVKAEYYNKQGSPYRVITAEKIETIQGYPTVTVRKVKNLIDGGYTVIRMSNIEYNVGIPERIFSERYLRRPPRRWLR